MENTTGKIYFAIKTDDENFGLESFNKYLSIKPTRFLKMFEKGKTPVCSTWEYSSGDLTNPDFYAEIENLVTKLNEHQSEFVKLKSENIELEFVLQIVMRLGDETPGLSFSTKTIQFTNELDAIIDCDIYNSK